MGGLTTPRKRWPTLPRAIDGILGPITVRRVPAPLIYQGKEREGLWWPRERLIEVAHSDARINEWFTLWHEWGHAVQDDLRLPMRMKQREVMCDALALARTLEMAKALGLPLRPGPRTRLARTLALGSP